MHVLIIDLIPIIMLLLC